LCNQIRFATHSFNPYYRTLGIAQFQQQANVITEATRFHASKVVSSLETFSETITSFVSASSGTMAWPFVLVPDFDMRGQRIREDAKMEVVGFSPLVTYDNRKNWVNYTVSEVHRLVDSSFLSLEGNKDIYRFEDDGSTVADDNILMAPFWETSPSPHDGSVINLNLFSIRIYDYLFNAMKESKHTALSAVYDLENIYEKILFPEEHETYHRASRSNATEHPHSVLMTPVYTSFEEGNRTLAGVVHGILPWDTYLTNLLPPGANGIFAVLTNTCGQYFTFEINGPDAVYLGAGDLHDPAFDGYMREANFGEDFLGEETRTYQQCFYSLKIYPSVTFKAMYESSRTEMFTGILAGIFLILIVLFFVFVWFVQRRQVKVMNAAIRTTQIVSSLFPANVRGRILEQAEKQANKQIDGDNDSESNANLRSILNEGAPQDSGNPFAQNAGEALSSRPIADLYPEATIMVRESETQLLSIYHVGKMSVSSFVCFYACTAVLILYPSPTCLHSS